MYLIAAWRCILMQMIVFSTNFLQKIFTIYIDKIFIDDTIYRVIQYHVYFFLKAYIILDSGDMIAAVCFGRFYKR